VSAAARISAALGLSVVLHGAMLAMIDRLPQGLRFGPGATGYSWAGVLHARLRSPELAPERQGPVEAKAAATDAAPRVGTGVPAVPRYLPASELDEKPQIRSRAEPEFPAAARVDAGRVVLRLYIAETGEVDEIAVVQAGPDAAFEEPAVRAFAGALFTPGRRRGVAVKSMVTIEVLFGIPLPLTQAKPPEGPLFQPPSRGRATPGTTATRRENQ